MTALPSTHPDRSIAIMGLGYVGLTLATVLVEVGYDVYGIEINPAVLAKLRSGAPHFSEAGLAVRVKHAIETGRLKLFATIPTECAATVFIITVGTPIGPDGKSRLDMVRNVASEIATHVKDGDMIIVRSTVRLGTTRKEVGRILSTTGRSFDLAFCPERTIEGLALQELRVLPQIVSATTFDGLNRASRIFQLMTPTVVRVSSLETAELIKLVDNAQRDVHFAYSNEVARICNAVGVSATEVIGLGKIGYPRTNLASPGPVGGPCLEKDPYILAESVAEFGIEAEMTVLARTINKASLIESSEFLANTFEDLAKRTPRRIALLGIAFKGTPATDDLRGTTAKPVFEYLRKRFPLAQFIGFDAVVAADDLNSFGLSAAASPAEAFARSDIVVILNNHPLFSSMAIDSLATELNSPALIYDFWNHYQPARLNLPSHVRYVGMGSHRSASSERPG